MANAACEVCQKEFPEGDLLFGDRGRICRMCELEVEEQAAMGRGVVTTVVSGPLMALTGSFASCAFILGPAASILGGFFGFWAALLGFRAIRVGWTSTQAEVPISQNEKVALFVSGSISLAWGLLLLVGGCFMSTIWVMAFF